MPIRLGLIGRDGQEIPLVQDNAGERRAKPNSRIFELADTQRRIVFKDVPEQACPVALRRFSAPVILDVDLERGRSAADDGP